MKFGHWSGNVKNKEYSPVRGSFMGRQAVHWFWCGSYLSMLDRCDTPLCPPTTNMKPSMTPTPKLILLSAMGATISQASLLGSYRSTLPIAQHSVTHDV